jgi:hypothetical protein
LFFVFFSFLLFFVFLYLVPCCAYAACTVCSAKRRLISFLFGGWSAPQPDFPPKSIVTATPETKDVGATKAVGRALLLRDADFHAASLCVWVTPRDDRRRELHRHECEIAHPFQVAPTRNHFLEVGAVILRFSDASQLDVGVRFALVPYTHKNKNKNKNKI